MASKKELYSEVARLNDKYCRNTKNELSVSSAYGGHKIVLTGKKIPSSKTPKWRKGSIGSGAADITLGYGTPAQTLGALYKSESLGRLQNSIKSYERKRF